MKICILLHVTFETEIGLSWNWFFNSRPSQILLWTDACFRLVVLSVLSAHLLLSGVSVIYREKEFGNGNEGGKYFANVSSGGSCGGRVYTCGEGECPFTVTSAGSGWCSLYKAKARITVVSSPIYQGGGCCSLFKSSNTNSYTSSFPLIAPSAPK